MNVVITGHHVNITDGVRSFVMKKLKKVESHFSRVAKIDIVLQKSNDTYLSEATVRASRLHIHAKSAAPNMFLAIQGMASKLNRQLAKHKEIAVDHGRRAERHKAPSERT